LRPVIDVSLLFAYTDPYLSGREDIMVKIQSPELRFDPVEDVLEEIAAGEIVIIVDDVDRENEGDLFCAAEKITPQIVNTMISRARGLMAVPLTRSRCKELSLPPMVPSTNSLMGCTFTVSVDLKGHGCSTGVSVLDRAKTIRALIDPCSTAEDFARPGHVFPLIARDGGVFERRGHTEAAVDLARLAGLSPAGVIVEILKEDGSMARRDDLIFLARQMEMKIISVEDLVQYRKRIRDYATVDGGGIPAKKAGNA
jgi:3,4-dihydroxy 2-butanone 4-phosphate synthase / GTP cyclohydrolase II